jgi:hypothetical protein
MKPQVAKNATNVSTTVRCNFTAAKIHTTAVK